MQTPFKSSTRLSIAAVIASVITVSVGSFALTQAVNAAPSSKQAAAEKPASNAAKGTGAKSGGKAPASASEKAEPASAAAKTTSSSKTGTASGATKSTSATPSTKPDAAATDKGKSAQNAAKSTADGALPKYNGPKVLPADDMVGEVALGYSAAAKVPEVCLRVFCYCGCDLTDEHRNLLDCFTSDHGKDCEICVKEAIICFTMHQRGKSLVDIQKRIDSSFEKEYPYEKPSPALLKYRAERLYNPQKASKSEREAMQKTAWTPVLKPGFKVMDCCAGKH